MRKVLIAFDNHCNTSLHSFFQDCADSIRQHCVDSAIEFQTISPPNLTEDNVAELIQTNEYSVCFCSMHGDPNGVVNDDADYVISVGGTNYNLSGKCFYSISCSCAVNLKDELLRIGLSSFWGYSKNITVIESLDEFSECSTSGLFSFLAGKNIAESRMDMLNKFNECISRLDRTNKLAAAYLLDNRENIIVTGEDNLTFANL